MPHTPIAAGKNSYDLLNSKQFFKITNLKKGSVFLDVACGTGAYSIAASSYIGPSGMIYAVDLWKEGIDTLKANIKSQNITNIQTRITDVSRHIPLEDNSVDTCLMATVLHDLIQDNTDQGTMKEVGRVLKPDGSLLIIEFKKMEGTPGPPLPIRLSPQELEQYLLTTNFRLVKTMDIGHYLYLSIFAG